MNAWIVLASLVTAVDAGARALGAYASIAAAWPAGWRAAPLPPAGDTTPYRTVDRVAWRQVVAAGVPRAVSIPLVAVVGVAIAWTFCAALSLTDLPDVFRGTRSLGRVLASFALCVLRAGAGWFVVCSAADRDDGHLARGAAAVLCLDGALVALPLPCSDVRADDVRVALGGLTAQLALAAGYAYSALRRRGLTLVDPALRPRAN
jgi:hypothetical protein